MLNSKFNRKLCRRMFWKILKEASSKLKTGRQYHSGNLKENICKKDKLLNYHPPQNIHKLQLLNTING